MTISRKAQIKQLYNLIKTRPSGDYISFCITNTAIIQCKLIYALEQLMMNALKKYLCRPLDR